MSSWHLMTVKHLRMLLNRAHEERGEDFDACYVKFAPNPKEAGENAGAAHVSTHFDLCEWEEKGEAYAELWLYPVRDEVYDPDFVPPLEDGDKPEEADDDGC